MDFELNTDQTAILEAVETLLARQAGPERARELNAKGGYDAELDAALEAAGFTELVQGNDTGPLEATLVLEAVARHAGFVAYGATALVAPASGHTLAGPVALALAEENGPVRYGASARTLLIFDSQGVRMRPLEPGEAKPVRANFGYPMAWVPRDGGDRLSPDVALRMRAWSRVALAAEAAGTMKAALDFTIAYVKQRKQFGRAIGSFQALQHRLAQAAVQVEGSRWLAYEAAWSNAPNEAAAVAAAYAASATQRVFYETHQQNGAIGFTREHDLHVWSMRLQALRLEMEGVAGHQRAVSRARWIRAEA